jgi:hypothetical protein
VPPEDDQHNARHGASNGRMPVSRFLALAVVTIAALVLLFDRGCDVTTTDVSGVAASPSPTPYASPVQSQPPTAAATSRSTRSPDAATSSPSAPAGRTEVTACKARSTVEVLPLFALAGLLLFSELSELAIPGLLSMKRRLSDHDDELKAQEEEVRALNEQLQEVRVTVASTASARSDTHIYMSPAAAAEDMRERTGKTVDSDAGLGVGTGSEHSPTEPGSGTDDTTTAPTSRAVMAQSVLEDYGRIEPYVRMGDMLLRPYLRSRRPRPDDPELTATEQDAVRMWYTHWHEQIRLVRDVRNAVAHPPAKVTIDDMQAALDLIQQLEEQLQLLLSDSERP